MRLRPRPLWTFLLVLLVAFSAFGRSLAGHASTAVGQALTEIVICGDDGPRTIVLDAAGNPVDKEQERSCCDGPCVSCAGCAEPVTVPGATLPTFSTSPAARTGHTGAVAIREERHGGSQVRAPPEDRS